jgi:hypothetical protein
LCDLQESLHSFDRHKLSGAKILSSRLRAPGPAPSCPLSPPSAPAAPPDLPCPGHAAQPAEEREKLLETEKEEDLAKVVYDASTDGVPQHVDGCAEP